VSITWQTKQATPTSTHFQALNKAGLADSSAWKTFSSAEVPTTMPSEMAATTAACKGSGRSLTRNVSCSKPISASDCDTRGFSTVSMRSFLARTTRLEEPSGLGARSALGAFNAPAAKPSQPPNTATMRRGPSGASLMVEGE